MKVIVTKTVGSRGPHFCGDYSVDKHFVYIAHAVISHMCHSFIFLEMSIFSFYSCLLVEDRIQYIVYLPLEVYSLVKKCQANMGTCDSRNLQVIFPSTLSVHFSLKIFRREH